MHRLSVKLILLISGTLILFLTAYTWFTTSQLRENLSVSLSRNSYELSEIVVGSTRYGMLLNRKEDVHQIINTIGQQPGVDRIRIYNKNGEIVFSTDSSEIGKMADPNAEACIVCHLPNGEIVSALPSDQLIRLFTSEDGRQMLGLIHPINNEKDCYTAECHAHEKDRSLLGVVDVIVPTEMMNQTIAENNKNIIYSALVITILLSGLTFLFIMQYINRPIHKLVEGIKQVSEGNLNYKINLSSNDEFGTVSGEFDQMTEKLNTAYMELHEWSETLNEKVEQKNAELKKIYEQITQIEKLASLGKLSATVAHELNNPLEGILTYARVIKKKLEKQSKDEHKEIISFLEVIGDESARCGRIVKDLLLFSRQQEEVRQPADITHLIEKALLLINHHFQINKITIIRNYALSLPQVTCDPQKIEQALVALLMNAVEAMGPGGSITITTAFSHGKLYISITDQGKGIEDKDLPYIFEPFYSTKKEQKGTGLGLAVVYGIITSHGGTISVKETSVNGTTIEIILPVELS
ncbi:MAG: Adaptive-response sensory-kinase SasA [Ignavibacteriaceae bacterium]|nr:Adaptive-response sensory-kinase SasA [Ignavibacteriaceae bacterium]